MPVACFFVAYNIIDLNPTLKMKYNAYSEYLPLVVYRDRVDCDNEVMQLGSDGVARCTQRNGVATNGNQNI